MILIFSNEFEYSTDRVIEWLRFYNQEYLRIDGDVNNVKLSCINQNGIYVTNLKNAKTYNLYEANACWWRRSGLSSRNFMQDDCINLNSDIPPIILQYLKSHIGSIINEETAILTEYIYYRIYENCRIKLGHPFRFGLNRLITLTEAKKIGLAVPNFDIVTNIEQIKHNQKQVTKAMAEGIYDTYKNHRYYSYTELAEFSASNIPVFPSLLLEYIEKEYEIRSFYLDGTLYSMVIFSQNNKQTEVDFRKYDAKTPNRVEPYKLPTAIEHKIRKLFQVLGLNTGSVDLILDRLGRYVFLEINPVGQYDMVSSPCNYNLYQKIAKYLIHGTV